MPWASAPPSASPPARRCPASPPKPRGLWGAAEEVSRGKDTPSGHWELAGVPVPWDWTYFPDTTPAFPPDLVALVCRLAGTEGILGNCHASGVPIIAEHCEAHLRTLWPICYTSADSVFQIAAHEEAFGLDRLLKLCADLAPHLHALRVGRVIARPFTGTCGDFRRTANRRDFAIAPPAPTLLDRAAAEGRVTHAIGKIGDIFSMRGIAQLHKGKSDADLFEHLVRLGHQAEPGPLTFANFVEFDTLYGHPRDTAGYARALEWFDAQVPRFLATLGPEDLAIFTADHGNDPTWRGTEHTRERVPVVARRPPPAPSACAPSPTWAPPSPPTWACRRAGQGPASCPDRPVRRERMVGLSLFFIPTGFRCLRLVRLGRRPPIRI